MKKLMSCLTAAALCAASLAAFPVSAGENDDLWERFLRYDLCVTDFDALTAEQQELCHFIFDTEQSTEETVVCERARRTLAGDTDLGERITLEQLNGAYGIYDKYAYDKVGWEAYIHCVPDIRHLDAPYIFDEYWVDDAGTVKVLFKTDSSPSNTAFTVDISSVADPSLYREKNNCFTYILSDGTYHVTYEIERDTFVPGLKMEKYYEDENGYYNYSALDGVNGLTIKDGNLYYISDDGEASLLRSKYAIAVLRNADAALSAEKVVVPDEVNGCPLVRIGGMAFENAQISEVELPDTIEFIEQNAFMNCTKLTSINFPSKLRFIGSYAFNSIGSGTLDINCTDLILAPYAFGFIQGVTDAKLNVKSIGESAFENCHTLKNVTLGESVEIIDAKAFYNCKSLEKVDLSSSVNIIGAGVFGCSGSNQENALKNVTLPSSIEVIGALPKQRGVAPTSGIYVPATHPLTDEAICAFGSDCVISGSIGSEADRYAEEWGLEFVPVGAVSGDVNGDSSVNMADADSIMRNTADPDGFPLTVRQKQYADVIGSDGVTNLDALTIQQFEAGIVTQLPVVDA